MDDISVCSLSENEIGDVGVTALAEELPQNTALQTIM
jgi:hypothetical protein